MMQRERGIIAVPAEAGTQFHHRPRTTTRVAPGGDPVHSTSAGGIIAVPVPDSCIRGQAPPGAQPLHLPRERGLRLTLTPLSLDGRGVGERVAVVGPYSSPHRPFPAGGEGEKLPRRPECRSLNASSQ